jgi:hypothetical protein
LEQKYCLRFLAGGTPHRRGSRCSCKVWPSAATSSPRNRWVDRISTRAFCTSALLLFLLLPLLQWLSFDHALFGSIPLCLLQRSIWNRFFFMETFQSSPSWSANACAAFTLFLLPGVVWSFSGLGDGWLRQAVGRRYALKKRCWWSGKDGRESPLASPYSRSGRVCAITTSICYCPSSRHQSVLARLESGFRAGRNEHLSISMPICKYCEDDTDGDGGKEVLSSCICHFSLKSEEQVSQAFSRQLVSF